MIALTWDIELRLREVRESNTEPYGCISSHPSVKRVTDAITATVHHHDFYLVAERLGHRDSAIARLGRTSLPYPCFSLLQSLAAFPTDSRWMCDHHDIMVMNQM